MLRTFCLTILCAFVVGCNGQNHSVKPCQSPDIPLQRICDSLHRKPNVLLISKLKYQLSVMSDTLVLKTYPVVLGTNPTDDKCMEGDRCTPEGTFAIRSKYPHKAWSKFIWIDYPNANSWVKHRKAKADGRIPKDAKIGGEVGIHGVPENCDAAIDQRNNWTWGCISLKNKDVNEIYNAIDSHVVVKIVK